MPPSVTTIPGTCCCRGTTCCFPNRAEHPVDPPPKWARIFFTFIAPNCSELDGITLPLDHSYSLCNNGGWRYALGADPDFGPTIYSFHRKNVGGILYSYGVEVFACHDCPEVGDAACDLTQSIYFRAVMILWRVRTGTILTDPNGFCLQTAWRFDSGNGTAVPSGACIPCATPLNLTGTFLAIGGLGPPPNDIGARCPEDDFCLPTWRGTFTE